MQGLVVTVGLAAMAMFVWQVWVSNRRDVGDLDGDVHTPHTNWRPLIASFAVMTICFAIGTSGDTV